jgi:hypothetical protein
MFLLYPFFPYAYSWKLDYEFNCRLTQPATVRAFTTSRDSIINYYKLTVLCVFILVYPLIFIMNVVVASTTHLLRWKEERISFPSLLAQSEKLSQIPVNESKGEEEG